MRIFKIVRKDFVEKSSIGEIEIDGKKYNILEDTVRNVGDKIYGEQAISAGRYKLSLVKYGKLHDWLSKAFPDIYKGVILLRGVPNYSGVCYHPGKDKDNTLGCLLPCMDFSKKKNKDGTEEFVTTWESSYKAFRETYPVIASSILSEDTYFEIVNECDLSQAQNAGVIHS